MSNFFTEMLRTSSFKLVISVPQQIFFNNAAGGPIIKLSIQVSPSFKTESLKAQYKI